MEYEKIGKEQAMQFAIIKPVYIKTFWNTTWQIQKN